MRKYGPVVALSVGLLLLCSCSTKISSDHFFLLHPNDLSITTAVQDALFHNENLATSNVRVDTTNGIVNLSGYVKTIRQSDTAEDIAKNIPGVNSVQNHLIVRK